jgi:DNA polymerase
MINERSSGAIIYQIKNQSVEYLLLKKSDGRYDLPKGHLEEGEDDITAARREIFEESGLKPEILKFFSKEVSYIFTEKGKNIKKTVRYFIGKIQDQNVRISNEHIGYIWANKEEFIKKIKYRNMVPILKDIVDFVERYEQIDKINKEYEKLPKKYKEWDLSKRHVKGHGPVNAKIMIIGQAPGRFEDEKLLPFIGRSGELLNKKIKILGVEREQIYITSCVQFFPPKNRIPNDEEVEICKPFLLQQIEVIKPKYIVLLGSLANKVLLNIEKVSEKHGSVIEKDNIIYMITYHPAAALRFKRISSIMDSDFEVFKKKLELDKIV